MTFWMLAAALTLACVGVLAWALWRAPSAPVDTRNARLGVFRARLAELDADAAAGVLDPAQHAEARAELEDAAAGELHPSPVDERRPWSARAGVLAVAITIPAVAFPLYHRLGTPQPPAAAELPALVAALEERLTATPDDLQGLMLLGRSRVVLGDYAGAVEAWRGAQRVAPDDPTVLANLAEALVLSDDAQLTGEAGWLLDAALAADPDNPKALWYGGLAADARGDAERAAAHWRALLAQAPPPALRQVLERRLRTMATAAAFGLVVTVGVDPARAPSDGWLFVTAHAPDGGPPLAAVRIPVTTWPIDVTLTERSAMLAETELAAHRALRIVARASASGTAARTPGDLIGEAAWSAGDTHVTITLSEVVE